MKGKNIFFIIGLIILTVVYLFLRLYKFEEKTTYHLDQGIHLLESWEMVKNKDWRLVGPMVTSKTFMDRGFFIGPQYYYVLAFLGTITSWNPTSIDILLLVSELGIILWFIFWIKKKYGRIEALTVFSLLTFSKYFIIHSRFFWNPHFLLSLGILAIMALTNYAKTGKNKYLWILGALWGLAFSFHYAAVFWGLPILMVLIINKKLWKKQTFIALPIGFVLGDLPWFVFELRNNFYNIKTILWVMTQAKNSGRMEPHYFVYPLAIFVIMALAWGLNKIKKEKKKICLAILLVISVSLFQVEIIRDYIPLGHPHGWTYKITKEVVNKILINGCPSDFNVASTTSGDTRAYDLRFLLTRKECQPMGVDKYPEAKTLFLIAPVDRPPETERVWEVSSLGKFKVNRQENMTGKIVFYELEKSVEEKK